MSTTENLVIQLRSDLDITASGKATRIAGMVYGGSHMHVAGYGRIIVDLLGMTRPKSIPLLADHESRVESIIGSATTRIENGQLWISGKLASGEAADRVKALLVDDVALQASVGLEPGTVRALKDGEKITVNGREHVTPKGGATLIPDEHTPRS